MKQASTGLEHFVCRNKQRRRRRDFPWRRRRRSC